MFGVAKPNIRVLAQVFYIYIVYDFIKKSIPFCRRPTKKLVNLSPSRELSFLFAVFEWLKTPQKKWQKINLAHIVMQ